MECDHHESHAASVYYPSDCRDAAVLTMDAVGEWATTSLWHASGDSLTRLQETQFPNSLGLFYSAVTAFLGLRPCLDEYKVMGLAAYGQPTMLKRMELLFERTNDGFVLLRPELLGLDGLTDTWRLAVEEALGVATPSGNDFQAKADIASSAQRILEELVLHLVGRAHAAVPLQDLCLAGGVAYNCVANGRVLREGPFRRVHVGPASGDSGAALGAALLASRAATTGCWRRSVCRSAALGPSFSSESIARLLRAAGIRYRQFDDEHELLVEVAKRLVAGEAVGWFQGRLEFGPRALGNRSILADPRQPDTREKLNMVTKQRESFRPFAPVVLSRRVGEFFGLSQASPYMTFAVPVKIDDALGAVTHVDGTARVQTVDETARLGRLIAEFEQWTGVPVLLNTSFNAGDEPIVCTPAQALRCFIRTGLESLVMEEILVSRESVDSRLTQLMEITHSPSPHIVDGVYTLA